MAGMSLPGSCGPEPAPPPPPSAQGAPGTIARMQRGRVGSSGASRGPGRCRLWLRRGGHAQHGADVVLRSLSFPPELAELAERDEPTSLPPRRLGLAGCGSGPQGVGFIVQSPTFTEPAPWTDSHPPSAATPRTRGLI